MYGAATGPFISAPCLRFLVRLPIREALPFDGLKSVGCALMIIDPKRYAVVVAQVELREIAVQMLALAMLVSASHAALEHREHAFNGVRTRIAAHVLACAVVYGLMVRKLLDDLAVDARAIGHEHSIRRDVLF